MPHWLVGIDENGLGPRLGPLVVTGVLASADDESAVLRAARKPRGRLAASLGDSKGLVGYGHSTLGEAWVRTLLEKKGVSAPAPKSALEAISLYEEERLRDLCPGRTTPALSSLEDQCWESGTEGFGASDEEMKGAAAGVRKLGEYGIHVHEVRTAILCTGRLNRLQSEGKTRLLADLGAMEELLVHFRKTAGGDLDAVCGKVGGYDRYGEHFTKLSHYLHTALEEKRKRAAYKFHGLGTVAFVQDADASNLLVGLASLVGKWVRDLLMDRIVRYYQGAIPELPPASGYYNAVTERFVLATALVRKDRAIPSRCFERVTFARDASAPDAPPS